MTERANSITRMSLADHFDACDESIKDFNDSKRDAMVSYRVQLENAGWAKDAIKAEVEAVKAAIKRRRLVTKDEAAVDAKDALIDEVLAEITARAPRATRVATSVPSREERRRDRFSESMDDAKALSAEAVALGLIDPKAHAETARIADALAAKFGSGPLPNHDPETGEVLDTSSTAARKDVHPERSGAVTGRVAQVMQGTAAGTQAPPVDTVQENAGGSDPDGIVSGHVEAAASIPQADEASADEAEPPQVEASSVPRKRQWKHSDPAHPDCLDPGQCGGFSNLGLCQRCKDAAA